jgi:hypothetical protein
MVKVNAPSAATLVGIAGENVCVLKIVKGQDHAERPDLLREKFRPLGNVVQSRDFNDSK